MCDVWLSLVLVFFSKFYGVCLKLLLQMLWQRRWVGSHTQKMFKFWKRFPWKEAKICEHSVVCFKFLCFRREQILLENACKMGLQRGNPFAGSGCLVLFNFNSCCFAKKAHLIFGELSTEKVFLLIFGGKVDAKLGLYHNMSYEQDIWTSWNNASTPHFISYVLLWYFCKKCENVFWGEKLMSRTLFPKKWGKYSF